jgi:hypothetical protein
MDKTPVVRRYVPGEEKPSTYQRWSPGGLKATQAKLQREGYLTGEDLALLIEKPGHDRLPPALRDYLVRYLRGEVKKRPGRKRRSDMTAIFEEAYASLLYEKALRVFTKLQKRKKDRAKARREFLPRGDLSPSEHAAEWVRDQMKSFEDMSTESVRNWLSKRRLLPNSAGRSLGSKRKA